MRLVKHIALYQFEAFWRNERDYMIFPSCRNTEMTAADIALIRLIIVSITLLQILSAQHSE